jgi:very-short-patch-repair endonuclease
MTDIDAAAAALAETQYGVFSHHQAEDLGASRTFIRRRLGSGRWLALSALVIRMAGAPFTWYSRVMAGILDAGPGAAASHRTAAHIHGLPGFKANRVEVSRQPNSSSTSRLALVHRSRWFPPWHMIVKNGIPVTTMARTLFDLAGVVSRPRLERALDNAITMKLVTIDSLDSMLDELAERGRTGVAVMRRLLAARGQGYIAPASELEAKFIRFLKAYGLPDAVRQLNAGGDDWVARVDFAYPGLKILIELDGRLHHTALLDSNRDRRRRARLTAQGWSVISITWWDLVDFADGTAETLRTALRASVA